MRNFIRNLKDPTVIWISVLALSLTLFSGRVCETSNSTELRRFATKVNCIAHDAKFTCDCQNLNQHMELPPLIGSVFQVEIKNCRSLQIDANVLEETQGLRKVTFRNVENLLLNKYALAFSRYASNTPLIIEFEKVNFELIDSHSITGNIEEISFIGGRIDVIHPFSFSTVKDRAMLFKMDNVLVKRIDSQAFKKFSIEQLEITNCLFELNVPSKAFYELEVLNVLRIHNNRFHEIHTRAFSFKMVSKLKVTNNFFESVDSEWIEAHVMEEIVIEGNYFGTTSPIAFKGISLHRNYVSSERLDMRFNNNTVQLPLEARPLEFNERFALSIKRLQYENAYSCRNLDTAQNPPVPKEVFFQTHIDDIYFRSIEDKAVKNDQNQSFLVLSKIIETDCKQQSYLLYIVIGACGIGLLIITVLVIVWILLARRRKRRKMDVIMPEPRTYKETQIVYQIENAGLLKTDL